MENKVGYFLITLVRHVTLPMGSRDSDTERKRYIDTNDTIAFV